ncbi:MAG: hypothetical protein ABMA15_22045 [Vicinamibacterales bacterium]
MTTRRRGVSLVGSIALVLCVLSSAGSAQQAATPLEPLSFLIGRWAGVSEGEPGTGRVEREYTWIFGQRFLRVDNQSTYTPQPKNPKGEVHRDTGMFSFDGARKRHVLRQFHTEGFTSAALPLADDKVPHVGFDVLRGPLCSPRLHPH